MKRIGIFTIALSLILSSCNGQTKSDDEIAKKDTIPPETKIEVNKEFDEEGNLVGYDSSYSSFYSNIENDTILADSLFADFKSLFNKSYPFSNQFFFNNLFFQDSLLKYDFYKKDFFQKRFDKNRAMMDKLFWNMDSIKNEYYEKQENDKAQK